MLDNLRDRMLGRFTSAFNCAPVKPSASVHSAKVKCSFCSPIVASTVNMTNRKSNYETQPQHKQTATDAHAQPCTNNKNHLINDNKHCVDAYHRQADHHRRHQHHLQDTMSTVNVYLVVVTLVVCMCTIGALLCTYIYQLNDVRQLRDNVASQLIERRDIEQIVRSILNDAEQDGREFR